MKLSGLALNLQHRQNPPRDTHWGDEEQSKLSDMIKSNRRGLDWILGEISSWEGWPGVGTGFPGKL